MKSRKISLEIGRKIRASREKQKYSQEGFADIIGVERAHYGAIERGERNISIYTLARVLNGLQVEINEIFPSLSEIPKLVKK